MQQYNNGEELFQEIKNKWNKSIKSLKIWGIIGSILMVIIGILCFFKPIQTTYFIEILASVALLVFGIWEIVRYVQKPVFIRNGVSLASGILNILLAIMFLTSPKEELIASFGFLFGLDLLMLGIEQLTSTGRLHSIGIADTGWLTADGIMNIIFGIALLIFPMASIAVSYIIGFYLIFGGISLFVIAINAKNIK